MKPTKTLITLLITRMIALFVLILGFAPAGMCGGNGPGGDGSGDGTQAQQNEGSLPWTQFRHDKNTGQYWDWYYQKKMQFTKPMTDTGSSGGSSGGLGATSAGGSSGGSSGSTSTLPRELVRPGPSYEDIFNKWPRVDTAHYDFPVLRDWLDYTTDPIDWQEAAYYPVSHRGYYLERMVDSQRMIERLTSPEQWMHLFSAAAQMTASNVANGAAAVGVNQDQNAIGFVQQYLINFPNDASSPFQDILKKLFYPMAILLLLPGAVLAQARAIVAQGSPILGEISPFEGLYRSLVAIFLIPGSFLVISYGIDVSNSITFSIADEYKKLGLGEDMYKDAQKLVNRGLATNPMQRDLNYIPPENSSQPPPQGANGNNPEGQFEDRTIRVRDFVPGQRDQTVLPDEREPAQMNFNRLAMNSANAGLAMTWNIMCAFQMAFLYYLWCMGPIAAALWVWPMERLRAAFPSWVEGVITLCFWSLFWNTVVLLMACFRGVGETGTVILTALNGLATLCVQYAFDFSSLVSQGAASQLAGAVQQAMRSSTGGGNQASSGGGRGAANAGAMAHGPNGNNGGGQGFGAGGFGAGALAQAFAGGGGRTFAGGGETFDNAAGVPGGGAVGRGGLTFASPFTPTSAPGGGLLNSWPGGQGGDAGLPASLRGTPFTNLTGDSAAAVALLAAARSGNPEALAALNAHPELLALASTSGSGIFDPNNPTGRDLLQAYQDDLRLHHPGEVASAQGFADFIAQATQGTPFGEQLNGIDPASRAALAQFLAENPGVSLNDPGLTSFLSNHPNGGFTLQDLNNVPVDQNLVSFGQGPPLMGNATDLTSFAPTYFDHHGNLITPNNAFGETGFHPGLHNPLNPDGMKGLEFVQYDANNVPHHLNIDPLNPQAFHDLNNVPGVNPHSPIYAVDPVTHQPIAQFNPSDPSQGWVGGNGHIHYDPQTGLGTLDNGVPGSFAYNMATHQWDLAGSNHAISVDPNSGQLIMAGGHLPVEQIGGHGGAPPYYQADLGNGQYLQSFDNGAHWVRGAEGGQPMSGEGAYNSSHAFEWNSQAGAFSLSGSGGNVLYDGSGMHVGPYQVVESGMGQGGNPNYSIDVGGHVFTSYDGGAHWVQQGLGGSGGQSLEWNRDAGAFSPAGSSNIVYDGSGMHVGPYQVVESGFGQGGSPAYSVDVGGHVFTTYDGGGHWNSQGAGTGQTMEWNGTLNGFVPEASHGQLVYTDGGVLLPNSGYHVIESGAGPGMVPTYTADLGGHVLSSSDGGATWNLPGGGSGAYEWNREAAGFTPIGLGSHSGVVVDGSGAHIPGTSAPVSVFSDQSGNTIFTSQWQGANITSSDGGVSWTGSGVLANSQFEFRNGELTQIAAADHVAYNPVQPAAEAGRASTFVAHDAEPTNYYPTGGNFYDTGNNTATVSGNQTYFYDANNNVITTDNGSLPFSVHSGSYGIPLVDNTAGQVAYNPDNQSMFIPGTNVSVTREPDGSFYASPGPLEHPVMLQTHGDYSGQWVTSDASGATIPVRIDQYGDWVAAQGTSFVAPTSEYPPVLPVEPHIVHPDPYAAHYTPYGQVEDLVTTGYPLGNEGRTIAYDGVTHNEQPGSVENQGVAALFVGDQRRHEPPIMPDATFHPAEPVIVPIALPQTGGTIPPGRGLADVIGRMNASKAVPGTTSNNLAHPANEGEEHAGSLQDQMLTGDRRGVRKLAKLTRREQVIAYLEANNMAVTEENIAMYLG